MVGILEDIAMHSKNVAARISAIKCLRGMREGDVPVSDGFAALDELAPRRKRPASGSA